MWTMWQVDKDCPSLCNWICSFTLKANLNSKCMCPSYELIGLESFQFFVICCDGQSELS